MFEFHQYTDRRVRKFGLHRRVFTTRLAQPELARAINREQLPRLIEQALEEGITNQVLDGSERDDHYLLVNLLSSRLHHAYQSHRFTVGEWRQNEEPARRLLEKISKLLNSNEQFGLNDSFQ